MNIRLFILMVACIPNLSSCVYSASFGAPSSGPIEAVSLVAVLSNPASFDGNRLWVAGVINVEHEGDSLYLTKEHYRDRISKNSISLSFSYAALDAERSQLSKLNGKYVLVEGVLEADCQGHLGSRAACMSDVTQITTVN